jgi:uncharacterized protein YdbL (DUF1318 family)
MNLYCKCGRSTATKAHIVKCPYSGYVPAKPRIIASLRENRTASYSDIAKMCKVNRAYVVALASRFGLRRGPSQKISESKKQIVRKLLRKTRKSYREIGQMVGLSYQTVKMMAEAENLPRRRPSTVAARKAKRGASAGPAKEGA